MPNPYLHCRESDIPALRRQFALDIFAADRRRLEADLEVVYAGKLAPTLFSWWCYGLAAANLAGQYQASLESLLAARHLLDDARAASRAREILLEQSQLAAWTDAAYGSDIGHDLASSHQCRAFASGLEAARGALSDAETRNLARNYARLARGPYLAGCFGGNAYLLGVRNTNWLSHLSGSVLLAELALAKYGLEDRATIALAKANVLRYVDMIAADGSLPEIGDYFHYGMEFALLSLGAFDLHFGTSVLAGYGRSSLRRAVDWPLAFTDGHGTFWADFGDTHIGQHEASRVVGYMSARAFGSCSGQWLGDLAATREPLAGLIRPVDVKPEHAPPRLAHFGAQGFVAVNFGSQSLALQGGPCRSDLDQIPHRHYDSGSIIYRLDGVNVVADSGFDRYTADYWDNFDGANHVRSASHLHNVVLADGRGARKADRASGAVLLCSEVEPGFVVVVWRMAAPRPGLAGWERQLLLVEGGPLVVLDIIKPDGAVTISVPWHLAEAPKVTGTSSWQVRDVACRAVSNIPIEAVPGNDHPKPYIRVDARARGTSDLVVASIFGNRAQADSLVLDATAGTVRFAGRSWDFLRRS